MFDKSGVVELIQGFYHPWDKMACMGGTKSSKRRIGTTYGVRKACMGGTEEFVWRIKLANWGLFGCLALEMQGDEVLLQHGRIVLITVLH